MRSNWPTTRYQKYFQLIRTIWEKREDIRAYVGILLSLTTISFFGVWALRPTLTTIADLFSQIRTQRETVVQLDEKIKKLQEAQTTWRRLTPDLPLIDQALPETARPELFARQIEVLAVQENVALSVISVGEITVVGKGKMGTNQFPLSFTVHGDAQRIFSFLKKLSTLRRALSWEIVTLQSRKTEEAVASGAQLTLSVNGTVPFYTTSEELSSTQQ
ncbi:MAG: type 4a pilus biogenesis protein PilO [Patescibacteria group bacterium]